MEKTALVIMAAGIGSILATQSPEDRADIVGLGIVSAALARISSAFVKDVVYAMLTDVLVSEKIGKNVQVTTVNSVAKEFQEQELLLLLKLLILKSIQQES